MFSCSSFRIGTATLGSKVHRQANFQKTTAIFSAWTKINTHAYKHHPPQSTASRAVTWAAGLGGVVLLAGLDCVAPQSYPYPDQAAGPTAATYWNTHATGTSSKPSTTSVSPLRAPLVATTTPHQYNIVIVGGGMAGLHTALALAERSTTTPSNPSIVVLDSQAIGQSASGRSKGLVVPGLQVPQEALARLCGTEMAQRIYDLTHQAAQRLQYEIVQKYQIPCDWIQTGLVEATLQETTLDDDDDDDDEDDTCRILSAEEVRKVLGQPESSTLYKGGELDTTCCGVDPLKLTQGLAHVLEQNYSVRIGEQTQVVQIEKLQDHDNKKAKYTVTTQNGAKIQCNHVVLCTGPELVSSKLSHRLKHAVIPIYTWMAATQPLGNDCPLVPIADGKTTAPMCGDDFVCLNYWRRTDDGRLLFGSLADAYPSPQWWATHRLRKALAQVYPQLQNVPLDIVWGGRLAFPRQAVPLIGRDEGWDDTDTATSTSSASSSSGVWYATGFGGHGIVPTVLAGSVLADAILGKDDETWRIFHNLFPPRNTFYPFSQLGAQLLLSLYNVFDWLHVKGVPVPQPPKPW